MSGIKIRMSRLTGPEGLIGDFNAVEKTCLSSAVMLVYPGQVPAVYERTPDYSSLFLLIRLTDWVGEKIISLCGAKEAAALGGDGCVVDLTFGYEDSQEIKSMQILAGAVKEGHSIGLPVIGQVRFNEAEYPDRLTECLEISLAAAEETGADAVILPLETGKQFLPTYSPTIPLFRVGSDGLIRRFGL